MVFQGPLLSLLSSGRYYGMSSLLSSNGLLLLWSPLADDGEMETHGESCVFCGNLLQGEAKVEQ